MLVPDHLCPRGSPGGGLRVAATALPGTATAGQAAGGDMLTLWAEATRRRRAAGHGLGGLRFAFYGRVSTEDWQDPVTSRARQRDQAAALADPDRGWDAIVIGE
jgi:hypothetical protein